MHDRNFMTTRGAIDGYWICFARQELSRAWDRSFAEFTAEAARLTLVHTHRRRKLRLSLTLNLLILLQSETNTRQDKQLEETTRIINKYQIRALDVETSRLTINKNAGRRRNFLSLSAPPRVTYVVTYRPVQREHPYIRFLGRRKRNGKNIQQRGFASSHPPDY
ncbi:hypothetical protein HBH56_105360 [Parastagonospora nodorum]|uniref:Uncharacterized protein n=1 Tax=Phaeosphaeria nodorum (strain SN15 / ATCC MYA-4574 / FGSC 10173) TaxID=321614 RepID=A0A7U2FKB0_PHANO|nr:hypothetical protein HBH56_105360 [Parastagonospora nodorum]QRD04751.1 hypothetical protein JI435_421620 [Parastagonospora nodorum SN15]KAH3929353.1 hypothetical protein HBH54_125050 [Parastagonospora nodorum]KAH3951673.1 hypothetical protein HBH53_059050 [Parastagonospora nodorum]KAH4032339.1 hypothetical protein HBI09_117570 [Parastagonospora nodorum]